MRARKHLLVVAVTAAVAGSALFLHVHLTRGHATRTAAGRTAGQSDGAAGAPRSPSDPRSAPDAPAGPLRLEGQTVDADNQPIAGATITLDGHHTAVTEADGAFAFDHLAEGPHRLAAEKDVRYAEDTVALSASSEPTVLTLRPGATLVLHVTADGQPLAGAHVEVMDRKASTNVAGTARFRGVELPTTFARVAADRRAPRMVRIVTGDDPHAVIEQTIALGGAAPVAGIVVDHDGAPVPGAGVSYSMADGSWTNSVTAGPDGRWRIDLVGAGQLVLSASAPRHVAGAQVIVALDGEHPKTDVIVRVERGATIIENPHDGLGAPEATRSPDGRFVTSGLRAGSWSLVIAGPDFMRKVIPGVRVTDGQTTDLGDIAVTRGRSISGHVRDERGQPIAGAQVTINDSGLRAIDYDTAVDAAASGEWIATADANGAYHIAGVPPDASDLQIGATDAHRAAPPRPVPHGSTVDLVLAATGEIRGVIVNEHGHNTVRVVSADQHTYETYTTEAHEFTIPRLSPGNYAVELHGRITSVPIYATVTAGGVAQVRFEEPPVPVRLVVRAGPSHACKQASLVSIESNGIASHALYDIDCETMDCEDGTVEFFDLAPGEYRLCSRGAPCQDVEVAASPAIQQATVRPTQAPR